MVENKSTGKKEWSRIDLNRWIQRDKRLRSDPGCQSAIANRDCEGRRILNLRFVMLRSCDSCRIRVLNRWFKYNRRGKQGGATGACKTCAGYRIYSDQWWEIISIADGPNTLSHRGFRLCKEKLCFTPPFRLRLVPFDLALGLSAKIYGGEVVKGLAQKGAQPVIRWEVGFQPIFHEF